MVGDEKHKYKKFYSQSGTQPGDLEALGCSPNSDPRYGRRYSELTFLLSMARQLKLKYLPICKQYFIDLRIVVKQ